MNFWRLLSVISLLSLIQNIHAAENFYWEFVNVDIEVQKNSDLLITETQKYVFTATYSNERYRWISLANVDKITDVAVFEDDKKLVIDTGSSNRDQLWIKWRHSLENPPESHTFVLKYRVVGGINLGIKRSSSVDQLHWKAIFKDRSSPIKSSQVVVHLPDILAGKIQNYRAISRLKFATRTINDKTIKFVSQGEIVPGEGLEIKVSFSSGFLELELGFFSSLVKPFKALGRWVVDNFAIFLLLFFIAIIIISAINTYGENNNRRGSGGGGGGGGNDGGNGGGGNGGGGNGGG